MCTHQCIIIIIARSSERVLETESLRSDLGWSDGSFAAVALYKEHRWIALLIVWDKSTSLSPWYQGFLQCVMYMHDTSYYHSNWRYQLREINCVQILIPLCWHKKIILLCILFSNNINKLNVIMYYNFLVNIITTINYYANLMHFYSYYYNTYHITS